MAVAVCYLSCQRVTMIFHASEAPLGSVSHLSRLSDGEPHCVSPRGFTYEWLGHPAFSGQGLISK